MTIDYDMLQEYLTDRRKVLDSEAMDMEFPTISDLSVDWIGRNIYYVDFYLGNICEFIFILCSILCYSVYKQLLYLISDTELKFATWYYIQTRFKQAPNSVSSTTLTLGVTFQESRYCQEFLPIAYVTYYLYNNHKILKRVTYIPLFEKSVVYSPNI